MNKLRTDFTGGMPNYLDNFRFYEQSVIESFAQVCRALAGFDTPLVLWGCKIEQNSTTYFCSEGAIYMNGVIYRVPQHSLAKLGPPFTGTYFWDVIVDFDPEGALVFQDQVVRNCYELHSARMAKTTTILEPGTFVPLFAPRIENYITRRDLHNQIAARLSDLENAVRLHQTQNGAAYFEYTHSGESITYPEPTIIPFQLRTGVLAATASHINLAAGAIYLIHVNQSIESGLRLTGAGVNQVINNHAIVKTPPNVTLGSNEPVPANFRFTAAANLSVAVTLLARDTSSDIIVLPPFE